jgi:hypothetical protein
VDLGAKTRLQSSVGWRCGCKRAQGDEIRIEAPIEIIAFKITSNYIFLLQALKRRFTASECRLSIVQKLGHIELSDILDFSLRDRMYQAMDDIDLYTETRRVIPMDLEDMVCN